MKFVCYNCILLLFYLTHLTRTSSLPNPQLQNKISTHSNQNNHFTSPKNQRNFMKKSFSAEPPKIFIEKSTKMKFSKEKSILSKFEGLGESFVMLTQKKVNKFWKILFILLIVLPLGILIFLLLKSSVEWASSSKTELNKLNDEFLTQATSDINNKFKITKNIHD